MAVHVSYTTRTRPPLPHTEVAHEILDSDYSLSVVFIGDKKSRSLNEEHRGKSYVPNVLSFPLDAKHGEIYINPNQAAREAPKHGMSRKKFIWYLFIHGLLHLKGYQHGATMEKAEARYLKRFF